MKENKKAGGPSEEGRHSDGAEKNPREKGAENNRGRRDPLLGAAIVKLSILTNRNGQGALFKSIYEGLLEDLSLTDGQVDEYLQKNWDSVRSKLS